MKETEFDEFASDYASLHAQSMGTFAGEEAFFASYKVAEVAAACKQKLASLAIPLRILDFGAGSGTSIPHFSFYFPDARLIALDVSEKSLDAAREKFGAKAEYLLFDGSTVSLPTGNVDIAFSACVFHHIDPTERIGLLEELYRVLKPGGYLFIFEHNPFNPITVRIVNRCVFDANAQLIPASRMKQNMAAAGFVEMTSAYRVFFPRILGRLRPLERLLGWLPLGGQYFVRGQKPFHPMS